jgi:hypothetical protein
MSHYNYIYIYISYFDNKTFHLLRNYLKYIFLNSNMILFENE